MRFRLLLFLLLLPLIWINVGATHDWGDDFAQYLIQAKNLTTGKPQTENGLVFPSGELPYALQAYPIGFPLLLAPIFTFFQLQIQPYLILNGILLIMLCILSFEYSKKYFDTRKALLIALLIGYNLFSLLLKEEILSEFAFTVALMGVFLLLKKDGRDAGKNDFVKAALLTGFLISIRFAGVVILPAVIGCLLMWKWQNKRERLMNGLIFSLIAVGLFLILNVLLFDIGLTHFIEFYGRQFAANNLKVDNTFSHLLSQLPAIFFPFAQAKVVSYFILGIILIGLIGRLDKVEISDGFFLLYILLLITYPYSDASFRFLFPVVPLLIIYFFSGAQKILEFISSKKSAFVFLTIITGISILFSLKYNFDQPIADGPYSKDARAAFAFIRKNVPPNEVVLFSRARAMVVYGNHPSTFLTQHKTPEENFELLLRSKCRTILFADERSGAYNESLAEFITAKKSSYDTLFHDNRYTLLTIHVSVQE